MAYHETEASSLQSRSAARDYAHEMTADLHQSGSRASSSASSSSSSSSRPSTPTPVQRRARTRSRSPSHSHPTPPSPGLRTPVASRPQAPADSYFFPPLGRTATSTTVNSTATEAEKRAYDDFVRATSWTGSDHDGHYGAEKRKRNEYQSPYHAADEKRRVEAEYKPSTRSSPSKHNYRTEWRERQGSASTETDSDAGIHGSGAYAGVAPKRKGFLSRLTSCFEFDESSDPVRRYRSKHEEMYGKEPVYIHGELEPSQYQAPNTFAGGMTGGSGAGGAAC
ncbi:hypothetical protein I317_02614 [Kwoniella heveanensis CBS 569]|nr:hypothetical protein I317_02614 [Kwoniella heveanensis CBS 569]